MEAMQVWLDSLFDDRYMRMFRGSSLEIYHAKSNKKLGLWDILVKWPINDKQQHYKNGTYLNDCGRVDAVVTQTRDDVSKGIVNPIRE